MRKLTEFAPSAGFYILALAAQVSGFTSLPVAGALFVVATLLLAVPARNYLRGWFGRFSTGEMSLHDFLQFVGIDPTNRLPPSSNKAYDAFTRLRQLAREEKVIIWGRPGF